MDRKPGEEDGGQDPDMVRYGSLRWELKQQFQGYEVRQYNIIMDVLWDGLES